MYGSRFLDFPRRVLFFWHTVGNKFLTLLSNILTNLNLTDMETGYKVFRTEVLRRVSLRSRRFDFEPEVTAKIARQGLRIYEVPISYAGRTYVEGKKINWKDGVVALWAVVRYNLSSHNEASGEETLQRTASLSRYNSWLWEQVAPFITILCLNVLEHIQDDEAALQRFSALLPSGGRLALTLPALKRLYGEIDKTVGHYRRYERPEIEEKLHKAGFRVEAIHFLNTLGVPSWYLNSCLLKRKAVLALQARLNDLLVPLLKLESYCRPPWGMSLLVVGEKG